MSETEAPASPVGRILLIVGIVVALLSTAVCGVAVVVLVALTLLGQSLDSKFETIANDVDRAGRPP